MVRRPRNHHSCQPTHAATVTPPTAAVKAIKVCVSPELQNSKRRDGLYFRSPGRTRRGLPNGHYFYRICPPCLPRPRRGGLRSSHVRKGVAGEGSHPTHFFLLFSAVSPGGASERRSVAPVGLNKQKKRKGGGGAAYPGLAPRGYYQAPQAGLHRVGRPCCFSPSTPLCVHLCNLRMIRCCLSVRSAIRLRRGYGGQVRNLPSPRPQRTGPQPKFHTVYGTWTGFDPLLMVRPDAWHLIIFRALGGQNARKCFCKNGTYVNLGLSKKVKKPVKTVKKL